MKRASATERLRYAFDDFMSRGTVALIAGLFVVSAILILVIAALVTVTGAIQAANGMEHVDFLDALWLSLLRTLDPGIMGDDHGQPGFVLAMFVVTLGGIFLVATLIGIVSSGLEGRLGELRKGRSRVIEEGHTVILGWNHEVFTVIAQLVAATNDQRRPTVVVLANHDKVAMEDEIRVRVPERGKLRVVCRSGSPIDVDEIGIARVETARAVIVLSPPADDPDTDVLKTLLAVNNDRHRHHRRHHIVAELREPDNLAVARMAGGPDTQVIVAAELVARITAQTCRQPGLSEVYLRLLDFAGEDIYVTHRPELVGSTFGDALHNIEGASLIGIAPADGLPVLAPPMGTTIGTDDHVIAISRGRRAIRPPEQAVSVDVDAIVADPMPVTGSSRTLILGWGPLASLVVRELARYVASGSRITVVANTAEAQEAVERLATRVSHASIDCIVGDTTARAVLDALDVPSWHHVILLGAAVDGDTQRADARTLVSLLHLRDIAASSGRSFSIVSEMHDARNRDLAEIARADDFIVSDRLVSLYLAQLAMEPRLRDVFSDLFEPSGGEIYLKPAEAYIQPGHQVTFATVIEAARRRGHVAIGYRTASAAVDQASGYGIRLDPAKSERVRFEPGDRVIVISED